MKELTKEQHEAILEFLDSIECGVSGTYKGEIFKLANVNDVKSLFVEKFPPSCCDSCADAETCDSEIVRGDDESAEDYMERLKQAGKTMSEPKYKHVVTFDMSNITDLTWEQSTKLSELLSLGKIILINHKGEQYLINTQDVKPADIIAK
jgi:trehalose-6-phosphatase